MEIIKSRKNKVIVDTLNIKKEPKDALFLENIKLINEAISCLNIAMKSFRLKFVSLPSVFRFIRMRRYTFGDSTDNVITHAR